ncbi:MAG: DUF2520 domain-containing protein [Bacteroidales bacterium]|nr:DUF2520 domain-containing protein [Bacteroidales bacterium]
MVASIFLDEWMVSILPRGVAPGISLTLRIVLIGAGNVATHFAFALKKSRHNIVQVFSRSINNAQKLAKIINAKAIDHLSDIEHHADLYIIAVSDNAIETILSSVNFNTKKVVHTAGSIPLSIFSQGIENAGVLYPFQTFSKERELDFSEVPLCIEANNTGFELFLMKLAKQLSGNVRKLNSEQRKYLHLSGVFACNFVNYLYHIAGNILDEKKIDRKILFPLIKETAQKIEKLTPVQAQTGPALRNDTKSLKKHLDLLTSKPEYQEIYKWFSKEIYKTATEKQIK